MDERGEGEPSSLFRYTERFYQHLPHYLTMGMTPEQFWEQDCALARAYRESYRQRRQLQNEDAWIQGMYIYEALYALHPVFNGWSKARVKEYRKEPYDFGFVAPRKKQTKEEKRLKDGKVYMEQFMVAFNAKFKGGETDGN
nr:MAG TPA: hypothetical protein [Caudoviricetes sp.]